MDTIKAPLDFLKLHTYIAYPKLSGDQGAIKRYAFCTMMKMNKLIASIDELYKQFITYPELEFGIGVMLRSLLMDCLCTLKLNEYEYQNFETKQHEEKQEQINEICTSFLHDGTNQMIDDIFLLKGEGIETKENAYKLASVFPMYYEMNAQDIRPKRLKSTALNINLKNIFKEAKHENHQTKDDLYTLYSYYSKYDHLSHWTGLTHHIGLNEKIMKINTSIMFVMFNFRDVLKFAVQYDPSCTELNQTLELWFQHIEEFYSEHNDS